MLSTKPRQFAVGSHCTFSLLTSSFDIPSKSGAPIDRGDTLARTIELVDVGIGSIYGTVVATRKSNDVYRIALLECIVTGARSSSEWSLASDCFDM